MLGLLQDVSEMVKGCAGFLRNGKQYLPFLRCVDCSLIDNATKCAEHRRRSWKRIIDVYNPRMWDWYVPETEV